MGYKRMSVDDLYNLFRRWRAGHSLSKIAGAVGSDRKTVWQYIRKFVEAGISPEAGELCRKFHRHFRILRRDDREREHR